MDEGSERTTGRRFLRAAEALLAIALLYALVEFDLVRVDELRRAAENPFALGASLALLLAAIPFAAWRWHILLSSLGLDLGYLRALRIAYIGIFFNTYLPGGVGGDAARTVLLFRELSSGRLAATLSLVADRVFGTFGLLAVALLAVSARIDLVLGSPPFRALAFAAIGLFVAALLSLSLALFVAGRRRLREGLLSVLGARAGGLAVAVLDATAAYRSLPASRAVLCLLLSVAVHALTVGALVVVAGSLSLGGLGAGEYALVAPLALLANALPVTPGGLGVGEAAFGELATLLEPARSGAAYATIFLVYRALLVLVSLPGVVLYLAYRRPGARHGGVPAE